MQATREQKANILPRILKLRDFSPFILVLDTLAQSAATFLPEFYHHASDVKIVEIFFEHHPGKPRVRPEDVVSFAKSQCSGRTLLFIDNLAMLKDVGSVLHQIMGPEITVVGVFHADRDPPAGYTPSGSQLLKYMATSIIEIVPSSFVQHNLVENPAFGPYDFEQFNQPEFTVAVTHRRRSGRALAASFLVNSKTHTCEYIAKTVTEDEGLLADLTTFNLTTTDKQRLERDKVDLPFLHAQELGDGGAQGGAIVYHFEKEDDYDEEDPYEDPF